MYIRCIKMQFYNVARYLLLTLERNRQVVKSLQLKLRSTKSSQLLCDFYKVRSLSLPLFSIWLSKSPNAIELTAGQGFHEKLSWWVHIAIDQLFNTFSTNQILKNAREMISQRLFIRCTTSSSWCPSLTHYIGLVCLWDNMPSCFLSLVFAQAHWTLATCDSLSRDA